MSKRHTAHEIDGMRGYRNARLADDGGDPDLERIDQHGLVHDGELVNRSCPNVVRHGRDQRYPFRTCLPAGCLVALPADASYITSLKKGTQLKVKAVADGGAETPFAVPLAGFGNALTRLDALGR